MCQWSVIWRQTQTPNTRGDWRLNSRVSLTPTQETKRWAHLSLSIPLSIKCLYLKSIDYHRWQCLRVDRRTRLSMCWVANTTTYCRASTQQIWWEIGSIWPKTCTAKTFTLIMDASTQSNSQMMVNGLSQVCCRFSLFNLIYWFKYRCMWRRRRPTHSLVGCPKSNIRSVPMVLFCQLCVWHIVTIGIYYITYIRYIYNMY